MHIFFPTCTLSAAIVMGCVEWFFYNTARIYPSFLGTFLFEWIEYIPSLWRLEDWRLLLSGKDGMGWRGSLVGVGM